MTLDALSLAQVHDSAADFEHEVIAALQREIGFEAAFFATLGEPLTTQAIDPDALAQAFVSRAFEDELRPIKQAAMRGRGVAVDTEVIGERAVRQCEYYRQFAAPIGGRHSLLAYLSLRNRPLGAVMLGRTGRSFSAREVSLLEDSLPALSMARASYGLAWVGPRLPPAPAAPPLPTPPPAPPRARGWLAALREGLGGAIRPWIDEGAAVATEGGGGAGTERDREGLLARVGGPNGEVLVRDREGHREMVARRGASELVWTRAALDSPSRSGWFYVELFHLAAARARRRGSALFIGAGGAVAVRQFAETYPGIRIDLVDLDASVVELAQDWFALGAVPALSTHVADGVDFVRAAPDGRWDVVVIDAYDHEELPASFASRAFFREVARVLAPGGAVAINVIGTLTGRGPVQRVEQRMRMELDDVRCVPVIDRGESCDPEAARNVVLLARRP